MKEKQKKIVIILANKVKTKPKIEDLNNDNVVWPDPIPYEKSFNDVSFYLMYDSYELGDIIEDVGKENKPDFMAIHTSVNTGENGSNTIDKTHDWLKDTHIKDFHSDGGFYREILPLILDEDKNEFPWEVFNKYYQTKEQKALNLLHKILEQNINDEDLTDFSDDLKKKINKYKEEDIENLLAVPESGDSEIAKIRTEVFKHFEVNVL